MPSRLKRSRVRMSIINQSIGWSEKTVPYECAKVGNSYAQGRQASNIHVLDRPGIFVLWPTTSGRPLTSLLAIPDVYAFLRYSTLQEGSLSSSRVDLDRSKNLVPIKRRPLAVMCLDRGPIRTAALMIPMGMRQGHSTHVKFLYRQRRKAGIPPSRVIGITLMWEIVRVVALGGRRPL